jgi:3-oxoacyl-[acyl-carrier-protein] synthase-3
MALSILRSQIVGCGSYLPARIVTNAELAERVDTTDAWIVQRTGIRQRHVAADDETTSAIGLKAAQAALVDAGMKASEIDLIIVATATPDHTFPATATQIQAALGIEGGVAFDLQAVCSGFVFALATADKFLSTGAARTALVIGAETFSRILDWEDRTTCVLFGDGAGAVVLKAAPGEGTLADRGVLATHIRSDGRYKDKLYVDGGPGSSKTVGFLRMEGKEVFRHAVQNLAETVRHTFAETGLSGADIDWFVPHQANRRIIDATADKLGIGHERVVITVDRHGNTSAASIPLALAEAHRDGRIKRGQLVLIEAMGGGFTWGSALIRW